MFAKSFSHIFVTSAIAEQAAKLVYTSNLYQIANQQLLADELCRRLTRVAEVTRVEALKEQDKRFEYKWYPKEGHGNVNIENRVDEWQRIQAFFYENL